MGRAARRLPAILLAIGACGSGALAALAVASPDARLASATSHQSSAHKKKHRRCTTRRRKGKPSSHRAARCPAKHHAPAKHPASPTTPSSGSTTGTGTLPATSPSGSGAPAPTGSGETPITPKPPEVPRVQVTAVEYKFTLSRTTVPAGKVILEFDNKGQDEHNLNVLSGGGELTSSFANEIPGGVTQETVDLKPGSYMLFCSLPEHEAKGMKATLVVE